MKNTPLTLGFILITLLALGCKDTSEPETIDVTFKGTLRNHCEDDPAPYKEFYFAVQESDQGLYSTTQRQEKLLKTDASGHFSVTFTMDRFKLKVGSNNVLLIVNAFNLSIYEQLTTVDVATGIWEQDLVMRPSYKFQLQLRTNGNGNNYTNLDTIFFFGNPSDSAFYPKASYNPLYYYITGPFQDKVLTNRVGYFDYSSTYVFWTNYQIPSRGIDSIVGSKENTIQPCNTTPDVYYIDLP
jgi:hypothetical protein